MSRHPLIPVGKLWSRSLKLAYTLLNKLGTKNEPVLKPGDRVSFQHGAWHTAITYCSQLEAISYSPYFSL